MRLLLLLLSMALFSCKNSEYSDVHIFYNSGTFSCWDEIESYKVKPHNESDCRNLECDTFGYLDKTSIICQGIYGYNDKYYNEKLDDGALGRHHSEVALRDIAKEGDVVWASYALYMSGNKNNCTRIISQWMDPNPDGTWNPHFMLIASPVPGKDELLINFNKNFYEKNTYGLSGCRLNEWNVFTFVVKLSCNNDGYIDLFINGVKVPNLPGHNGEHTYSGKTMRYSVNEKRIRFQCGGYVYWNSSSEKFKDSFVNYLDEIRIANSNFVCLYDMLPSVLPNKRNMKWKKINM